MLKSERGAGETAKAEQVAALPWRLREGQIEVLLITSRERKRWVIPKGWPMQAQTDFNAAKIEAFEEAGVTGRIRRKPLGIFFYDKLMEANRAVATTVTVYALEVEKLKSHWPEESERQRRWFTPFEAASLVEEQGLAALILSFQP